MGKLTALLLLLWIAITVGTEVNLQKRIYGGTPCPKGDRKYHVKLIATNGIHSSLCGGSLISDRWILTAAHCWKPTWTMHAVLGVHPGPGHKVPIIQMVPFTDGNQEMHDIMLLQLRSATKIQPVKLPGCKKEPRMFSSPYKKPNWFMSLFTSDTVRVAGHGRFQINAARHKIPGSTPDLRCAKMKVADCSSIRSRIQRCFPNEPFANWLCAEGNKVDTCEGDSGGGLVHSKWGVTRIYAVISGGFECACAAPAVFLKVCPYIKWIRETIAQKS